MPRSILLTAVFAALTAVNNSSTAVAQDATDSRGQISKELLAQFGLGGSALVTDTEGKEIRGKGFSLGDAGRGVGGRTSKGTVKPFPKKYKQNRRRRAQQKKRKKKGGPRRPISLF